MNLGSSRRMIVAVTTLLSWGCGGEGTSQRNPGGVPVAPANPDGTPGDPALPGQPWQPAELDPTTPVGRFGQLQVQNGALLDQAGNPVQLKGVSTMWLNWEQTYSGSKEGLRWMRDNWGLTVVRAAMGVDEPGAFLTNPTAMLSQVRTVVQNAIDLGVYVLIDWHDHTAELHQDAATEFFARMAAEFGQYPNVFYETYNEPVRVDWSTVVKPYHEAVSSVIRETDPDNIIILGTPLWSQKVDDAARDPLVGTNLMYTVHFYSCDHRAQQRAQAQFAIDQGLALFVTEWGATTANGGTIVNGVVGEVCTEEATLWHDFMDQNGISWTAWKLDDCTDLSCLFRAQAPRDGGWTDEWLNGHAPFVRDRMQRVLQ
jgi:endoglucanase